MHLHSAANFPRLMTPVRNGGGNSFQYQCLLKTRVRAAIARNTVLNVAVPWAREGSGFRPLFETVAMLLCRKPERSGDRLPQAARRVTEGHQMPMAAVADSLGEHDTRLWRVALTRSIQELAKFTSVSAKPDLVPKKNTTARSPCP